MHRSRRWLELCGRQDLLLKPNFTGIKAYNSYMVCSDHFDNMEYNNPIERTSLLPTAEPRPFRDIGPSFNGKSACVNVQIC